MYHFICFRKCTGVQRMFHELSEKVMDKAFIKTREHFQNSYPVCNSTDAWIKETHPKFMKCTERLQMSNPSLLQYLKDIERIAIQNTYSTLETQIWEQMEDASIDPLGSDGLETALFYIKTASAASMPSNLTCSQVRHCKQRLILIILIEKLTNLNSYYIVKIQFYTHQPYTQKQATTTFTYYSNFFPKLLKMKTLNNFRANCGNNCKTLVVECCKPG